MQQKSLDKEARLLRSRPRKYKLQGRSQARTLIQFIILPHLIVGPLLMGYALFTSCVIASGENVDTAVLLCNAASWGAGAAWVFICSIMWTAAMIIPLKTAFVEPLILSSVFRNGKVAAGSITEKEIFGEEKNSHRLHYDYELRSKRFTGTIEVSEAEYQQSVIGELVNVLYDPARPNRSLLYRYSDYKLMLQLKRQS